MARRPDYQPRTDGAGSGRRARAPVHRTARGTLGRAVGFDFAEGVLTVLQIEHCRCGAWRARVALASGATFALGQARALYTDWSAPCSDPSPAPARDDA